MSEQQDFERAWLGKFSRCLEETVGAEVRDEVMVGSEILASLSDRSAVIAWTQAAMERLDARASEGQRRRVMTGCACQYPKANLQDVREAYAATGDVELVHGMLQERFAAFLRDGLQLDRSLVDEIVSRGWGLAGLREGQTIIATKIPKSGHLVEYMAETDPQKKRQLYCHCPRIRDVLRTSESLSGTYCYCGAGFYQSIWEEILQRPVEVEVLESVLTGGEVCKIGIYLQRRTSH